MPEGFRPVFLVKDTTDPMGYREDTWADDHVTQDAGTPDRGDATKFHDSEEVGSPQQRTPWVLHVIRDAPALTNPASHSQSIERRVLDGRASDGFVGSVSFMSKESNKSVVRR